MRVIVTGAAGFLGRHVVARLSRQHDVVATDIVPCPGSTAVVGDLGDPVTLDRLFSNPRDAVIHLASLPGGACESDPARGWHVNIDTTCRLADAAMRNGARRFVFASSIAVFGDVADRACVDDTTPLRPSMVYGGHKAMIEIWLATLGRRGDLAPLALRFPGLVARGGTGAGLKSAFLSNVFKAALDDRRIRLPVSSMATAWLMSVRCAADAVAHALELPESGTPGPEAVTLPAVHTSIANLIAAPDRHADRPLDIAYEPDPAIELAFGRYPPLYTPAAENLGFRHDGDLDRLVKIALEDLA